MKEDSLHLDNIPFRVLIGRQEIDARVSELGRQIGKDYEDKSPLFVCVLRGGVYFFSDLTKSLPFSVELDFIQARSYQGTESVGEVELVKDLDANIKDRHIVIVEDIVDTGKTLKFLIAHILLKKPASLEVAALLFKEGGEAVDYPIKYVGWKIGKEFVIGYGLDYDGKFRNLPGIYVFQE
ncbi:hypoxanthine phosphoribosyltransferase [Leptospira langatensis]|uniref:Hypoxanthine phosphoribosyltransferase n=1 Tax=Leptospira langatensis TaxID=2484983 RepID=A0A5F1ZX52_9LEPT|nr:hypoxanthine phosphoribosyltransferase [Leptospira langatensis]TGK03244.1 hypoxanthine phosphoribosyltransferase [Leptospira langatensis]TGL42418.1 hypoxanthine phosphoribosyltransferase [Leptospira langatensis]